MDWLTFTVEVIKALAWPLVAVLVIIVFHKRLTELLEQLTEFKGWGTEAKFAKKAEAALVEAKTIEAIEQPPPLPAESPAPTEPPFDPNEPVPDHYLPMIEPIPETLISVSPIGAMMMARRNLESAVKRLVAREAVPVRSPVTLGKAFDALKEHNIISARTYASARNLMRLGNEAAHDTVELRPDTAESYISAINAIIQVLLAPRKSSETS